MMNNSRRARLIIAAVCFVSLLAPGLSIAGEKGHDWYCPDQEGHAMYEKHRRLHHDDDASVLADKLAIIFQDSELSAEQQKTKATGVLNDYVAKAKMGLGD